MTEMNGHDAIAFEEAHRPTDQVFSTYQNGQLMHFNASLLRRIRERVPEGFRRITMDIGKGEYSLCMNHRGIEQAKLDKLTPNDLREPGIGVLFDEGTFSIVDGHHRLVARYRMGLRTMDFYVTSSVLWSQCLVEYSPEEKALIEAELPPKSDEPDMIASAVLVHKKD